MKATHHSINYIEFPVLNMEKTKTFYSQAFSWEFNDYAPGYAGIRKPGEEGEAGGFSLVDEVKSGGPLIVLYSENLEDSLDRVKKAEGEITKDIFSFPGGRRFEFKDPNGIDLAVWSE